ncbi:hypothetical protein EDF46_0538 [Frondihabitans sp. PhB188]|uniref:hypothetical protein n=1 Tax=Frondihabitans sp. PhB188 TaxID=2485200 RepID=UPI000F97253E|nr:hypothetical protein [Frondihabitans sp. PhB188]ROQ41165.1 hypothetical protein EDF46_0538 [Frondihabitans sp. PhB188]
MAPPPPEAPSRVSLVMRSLTGRDWIVAAVTGVAGFLAAYVVAVLSLLLTALVLAASASGSGAGSTSTGGASPMPGTSSLPQVDASSIFTILAGAPAQLVLLADLGRLRIAGSLEYLTTVSGSAHLGSVPVMIALAQIAAIVLLARTRVDVGSIAARRWSPRPSPAWPWH